MIPFAIQCYSVRDQLARDPAGTLNRLKEAGYDCVELFGVDTSNAFEYKRLLDAAKLRPVSAHMDYDHVVQNAEAVIDAAKTLRIEYIVVPWVERQTQEEWIEIARTLNSTGELLRSRGVRLGYHNHDHEFRSLGDHTAFDILFDNTSPDALVLELDVYWTLEAGTDPVRLIRKFGKRCPLLHIKDKAAGGPCPFAEIGHGTIDWEPVFRAGSEVGVEWYIVEQDESARDPLESAAMSAAFMASK